MHHFEKAELEQLIIHYIGNKNTNDILKLSSETIDIISNPEILNLLKAYFLSPFKLEEYYNLSHESNINLNEVFSYSKKIFGNKEAFIKESQNLAKHLFEKTSHPRIKEGELYIAYFSNCFIDGSYTDAIGLFKSENKETFLKVYPKGNGYELAHETGININKLDKGAIIFNTQEEAGFTAIVVDLKNKGIEAQYWREYFLNIKPTNSAFQQTQQTIDLCKSFIKQHLQDEFELPKAEQAIMLNRSHAFFKEKEEFSEKEFTKQIIEEPSMIKAFKNYKKQYEEEHQLSIPTEFEISGQAVKKQQRKFRSIIKLDKNFHIYVHGNQQMITKGVDKTTGMNFYQLYFNEEA